MSRPSIAIIGASRDRHKFGNKAVRAYLAAGYEVYPINPNVAEVEGLGTYPSLDELPVRHLDRVSFYVPPGVGVHLLESVARKDVDEVWLNPGADGPAVVQRAEALGLNVIRACSLLAVGAEPYAD